MRRSVSAFLCGVVFAACPLLGQNAELSGTITDPSGSVVPQAAVRVLSRTNGWDRKTETNAEGIYAFASLPPGAYDVEISKQGFQTLNRTSLTLQTEAHIRLDFSLKVGDVAQVVTVEAGSPLINSSAGSVSTVIDRELVEQLPLNGRSFQTLFQLTPGVVIAPTNSANFGQFSVNGQRTASNYTTVDGVSANIGIAPGNLGQTAAGTQMGTSILGGTNNLVSVDSLEEFRIQTSSFAPEYGRTPGGQISIVTRSGTNQIHGSVFDYFRNDKLDANNWFVNQTRQPRPQERQNDFGGILGGPIIRDHTFLFFSYEGLRLRPQTLVSANVPSVAARQSASSSLQPYLNAFPLPNGPDLANGFAQENAAFSNPSSLDSASIRIDQKLGRSWTVFGRFSDSPSSLDQRGASSASLNSVTRSTITTRTLTSGATWLISPSVSNDFRFGLSTNRGATGSFLDDFGGAVPLTIVQECPGSVNCSFILSLSQTNATLRENRATNTNSLRQINLVDSLAISHRAHRFVIGADLRLSHIGVQPPSPQLATTFTGVGPASQAGTLLSGVNSSLVLAVLPPNPALKYANLSLYAQDTWQFSHRLNVTYGLRWEINPAVSGSNLYNITGADNPSQLALGTAGTPLWSTRYRDLAPRLGAAYLLSRRSNHETVLRAGAGIFYDLVSGQLASQITLGPNSAGRTSTQISFPYSNIALPTLPGIPPYNIAVYAADPNLLTPATYQWNVAVEQGLGANRSLSLTYIGSRGIHLSRQEVIQAPNPTFVAVSLLRTNGESRYNALQLQYQQRIVHDLQALANYSFARSVDTASTDTTNLVPSEHLSPSADKGPSDFDVRHGASGALTYILPEPKRGLSGAIFGGWATDLMFVGRTAFPLNVSISRDLGYGTYNVRPDLVPGVPLYFDDPNVASGKPLNAAAFMVPGDRRQGSLGRNAITASGMYQWNSAAHKTFHMTERTLLQARIEFFNLTNHPNFSSPNGTLGSVSPVGVLTKNNTFGISTAMLSTGLGLGGQSGGFSPLYQMGGPRSVQLSLKFSF